MRPLILTLLCAAATLPAGCSQQPQAIAAVDTKPPSPDVGPHGGRMLRQGDFALEVAMVEGEDVPPRLNVYAWRGDKPLAPGALSLEVTLKRLGGRIDRIGFVPEGDHLASTQTIGEPHSFDVVVRATTERRSYDWTYPSYEGRLAMPAAEAAAKGLTTAQAGPAVLDLTLDLGGGVVDAPARQIVLNLKRVDADDVKPGQPVTLTANGRPIGTARIASIEPFAEQGSFATTIAVPLPAGAAALPAGTPVTGRIALGSQAVPLAVRTMAIQHFRTPRAVLAQFGDTYEVRILEIGRQTPEWSEVKSGIEPGTPYVATNAFVLGARLDKSESGIVHAH